MESYQASNYEATIEYTRMTYSSLGIAFWFTTIFNKSTTVSYLANLGLSCL